MFIRETTKVDKKTDKKYTSYQLVESYRTHTGPRQKILLTLTADIALTAAERKELANRIEEIYKGTPSLFIYPAHIETLAQHFGNLLLQKKSCIQPILEDSNDSEYYNIDINNVRHTSIRTIGCEHVALAAYQELGFENIFDRLKFSTKQKLIAAAAIIGRAIYPYSERALHNRLKYRSGLDELLRTSFANLSLDQLYFISDALYASKKGLERHLREREKTLFNLKETIILYDITNTYFEGSCKSHPKAKRGKSKEQRSDCPLLAIGVVLDAEGFPKHSEIFEGNINERATLQEMVSKLHMKGKFGSNPIIVLDSGIATKDNIDWLKKEGYFYIVMMKKKDRPSVEACQSTIIRDNDNQFITATLAYDEETGDNVLWCYSQERLKKEQDIKRHKTDALEKALAYLKEGLARPGRIKDLAKVHQKIGRFREKFARLAQHYNIVVHPSEDGQNAQDITWTYDEAKITKSFSGTYTLRTNVKDLSAENIWEIYVMLSEAEACFRCLKSEAGLRPNWHSKEARIEGHIFISLLAYHLIAFVRRKLKDRGIYSGWETIKEKLSTHTLVTTTMKTQDGTIYLRQTSEPDEHQKLLYQALSLPLKPIKGEKTFISKKDVVSKN